MTTTTNAGRTGYRGESWQLTDLLSQAPGFHALSDTLCELVDEGVPISVLTADLKYSNGLVRFEERHPKLFHQFGISEQNMVSAAAGMASVGRHVYASTFASFLALLCAEQIRTDIAYTKLPVRLVGHHTGVTLGFYGTSHHATEDLAIMRSMANMMVLAPADPGQLRAMVRALAAEDSPAYLRVGRGRDPQVYTDAELSGFQLGKAMQIVAPADLSVIATGSMVAPSKPAVETLAAEGITVGLLDMHTIKPLDVDAVREVASRSKTILTVEEHNVLGGLGSAVAEVVAGLSDSARLVRHGVEDEYAPVGPPTHLYKHFGLDAAGIEARIRRELPDQGQQ
jgi:transketolase